jgi:single-strand DNA-binding protein
MSATISGSGRVVKEGTLRTAGASEVLGVRVAVDQGFGDKKTTNFFQLNIWGKQARSLEPILQRGTFIVFTGEFSTREWGNEGAKKTDLEVRVDRIDLGPRAATGSDDRRAAAAEPTQTYGARAAGGSAAVTNGIDDEIPF